MFAERVGVLGLSFVLAVSSATAAMAQQRERAKSEGPGTEGVPAFDPAEGRLRVVSCLPEGAAVKKGDPVCTLDPAPLEARLKLQATLIEAADAALRGARLAREAAEVALDEYKEGGFKQEWEAVLDEIALAEADRKRAADQRERSDRMLQQGYAPVGGNVASKISLQQKVFAYEQALTKKNVLEKYTKDRRIKELKGAVEEAKAKELTRAAALEGERAAREALLEQVAGCKVLAAADGRVRYPQPLGAGAVVRDGQLLFRVVPDAEKR